MAVKEKSKTTGKTTIKKSNNLKEVVKPKFDDQNNQPVPLKDRYKMEKRDAGTGMKKPDLKYPERKYTQIISLNKKNKDTAISRITDDSKRTLEIRKKVSGYGVDYSPEAIKVQRNIDLTPLKQKKGSKISSTSKNKK
ncbi:hypothetical protein [Spiroplasma endosymbiont of Labia minor]|uniref:hypothetical protein n=1 Tax=Spiroplasma endosymbiont of Labia minor TaxID=3066305 RepID=UPI0030D11300